MLPPPPSLYFSLFGGMLYRANSDEEAVLDAFQIPLKQQPPGSCKKCHGQFHTGYDTILRLFILCSQCSRKCLDMEKILQKRKLARK